MKPSLLTLLLAAVGSGWGQEVRLPQGFPDPLRTLETKGPRALMSLSTPAYQREARRLLLQEANQVATELSLSEEVPLTENIVTFTTLPFGWAYVKTGHVGSVMSRHYTYTVGEDWRFNHLLIASWSGVCANYARSYRWPSERLDTNAAYHLATQWLAAVSMDVTGLNRACHSLESVQVEYAVHERNFHAHLHRLLDPQTKHELFRRCRRRAICSR